MRRGAIDAFNLDESPDATDRVGRLVATRAAAGRSAGVLVHGCNDVKGRDTLGEIQRESPQSHVEFDLALVLQGTGVTTNAIHRLLSWAAQALMVSSRTNVTIRLTLYAVILPPST